MAIPLQAAVAATNTVAAAPAATVVKTAQAVAAKKPTRAPTLKAVAEEKIAEQKVQAPRVNPEIDAKLDAFIQKEKPLHAHYQKIVAENPERAVRMLMLNKMTQAEYRQRQQQTTFDRLKQWVAARPEVAEKINQQIAKLPEDKREGAFVNIANRAVISESTRQGPKI